MERTALRIRTFGDFVLRKKSVPVKEVTSRHREILSQMAQLMYDGEGVGLAAPQAGVNENMIVVDIGRGLYRLINPRIIKASGSQVNQEGCLSVPGVCIKVKRANKVTLQALDDDGKAVEIKAEGLLACVFQHEIDHLKGKLIVDYASFLKKVEIARILKELKNKAADEVSSGQSRSCKLKL